MALSFNSLPHKTNHPQKCANNFKVPPRSRLPCGPFGFLFFVYPAQLNKQPTNKAPKATTQRARKAAPFNFPIADCRSYCFIWIFSVVYGFLIVFAFRRAACLRIPPLERVSFGFCGFLNLVGSAF